MTNYLLSIDPSIKNTGFTLWEEETLDLAMKRTMGKCPNIRFKYGNYECIKKECEICDSPLESKWKPILITSFDFKKYDNGKFLNEIEDKITDYCFFDNLDLIIERGTFHSKNGIGYETQEHLRGFIAGQFNKLLKKNMLISPRKWQNWYQNKQLDTYWYIKNKKWTKEISLIVAKIIIEENNWNITISNHDEADSLLIGWYYLNDENKND